MNRPGRWQWSSLFYQVAQIDAWQQLHDVEEQAFIGLTVVEDLDRVRMSQAAGGLHFVFKALQLQRIQGCRSPWQEFRLRRL